MATINYNLIINAIKDNNSFSLLLFKFFFLIQDHFLFRSTLLELALNAPSCRPPSYKHNIITNTFTFSRPYVVF